MGLDIDKIADDIGLPRDKFRAGVQRIQREQKAVAWANLRSLEDNGMKYATSFKHNDKQSPLFTFPPATPSAVPDGWQLVPKEPTYEMVVAAVKSQPGSIDVVFGQAYRTMLSAAPAPAGEKGEQ